MVKALLLEVEALFLGDFFVSTTDTEHSYCYNFMIELLIIILHRHLMIFSIKFRISAESST